MDSKILKSAGLAVGIVTIIGLSGYFLLVPSTNWSPDGWGYIFSFYYFLFTPVIGFLSIYLYKRERGILTQKTFLSVVVAAAAANAFLMVLSPMVLLPFNRITHSPAEYLMANSS